MTSFVIDGQRRPKPSAAPELRLRDVDILRLPQPLTFEDVSIDEFLEAGGFLLTVPAGLGDD